MYCAFYPLLGFPAVECLSDLCTFVLLGWTRRFVGLGVSEKAFIRRPPSAFPLRFCSFMLCCLLQASDTGQPSIGNGQSHA